MGIGLTLGRCSGLVGASVGPFLAETLDERWGLVRVACWASPELARAYLVATGRAVGRVRHSTTEHLSENRRELEP